MPDILVYVPTVGRGGVHRVVETLLHTLHQIAPVDWHFAVLGQTFNEIGQRVHYPDAWPFTQIDPGPTIPPHPRQFEWLNAHTEVFFAHLKRVHTGYDLIFCPSPWWTMRVRDFSLERPFVTVVPDFAFDHINMGGLSANFRYIAREIARRADLTIFPSNYQRGWGEKFYGFDPQRTRTIHHSADFVAQRFEATHEEGVRVREKYGLPERYVLAFHCAYHKDPITILRGQLYARQKSAAVPPLVMGGIATEHFLTEQPIDGHIDEVRHEIRRIKARPGEDLFIVGQVPDEDIAGLYMNAACAVTASRSEGDLSGTIFEAFMASCPLIYSDLDVFTEQLGTAGEYGLHFPVAQPEALGRRIIEVCEQPEPARQRALRAFGFANQRSRHDVARDYLIAFAEAMGTAGKTPWLYTPEDYVRALEQINLDPAKRRQLYEGEWVSEEDAP